VLRYTAPTGKRREMGLGAAHRANAAQAGDSLTSAREAAAKARAQLQQGLDLIEERERLKATQRSEAQQSKVAQTREDLTLARAARDYHARVVEPQRTDKHAAQWLSSLENHLPAAVWHKPIAEIEPPELLQALLGIRPHERARNLSQGHRLQETVQRIRQRLDAIFEDAIFYKRCTSNPAAAIKRKLREELPQQRKGAFAALPYAEAPALMRQLRRVEGIAARCLEFGMLTAARTGELIGAEEAELDLEHALWVIPGQRMKAGEPHTVYLCERAIDLVRDLVAIDRPRDARRWLFPTPRDLTLPLTNMAMLMLLDRLGLREKTTVHGLCRATFSTWAYDTNAARPDVIEACLAHQEEDRVKAAYNRAQFAQERRALLAKWATYLNQPTAVALPRAA
jgi:integrase